MNRTVFSLPTRLHRRAKLLAERRGVSMAALIRETLTQSLDVTPTRRIAEAHAAYVAVAERPHEEEEEAVEMKRIVISLPEALHRRLRAAGESRGISMAAYIRDALDERTRRERPKPSFGAFASGFTDTARLAGEMPYEPRSWR